MAETQPTTQSVTQEIPQSTPLPATEPSKKNTGTYIFIGILTIALMLLLYYGYNRFVMNTLKEPMTTDQTPERDDPVIDFNLREEIKDLQRMQKKILSGLSEVSSV